MPWALPFFIPKPEPTGDPQPKGGRDARPPGRVPEVNEGFLSVSVIFVGCRWRFGTLPVL